MSVAQLRWNLLVLKKGETGFIVGRQGGATGRRMMESKVKSKNK